jgi:hypothetical protein
MQLVKSQVAAHSPLLKPVRLASWRQAGGSTAHPHPCRKEVAVLPDFLNGSHAYNNAGYRKVC